MELVFQSADFPLEGRDFRFQGADLCDVGELAGLARRFVPGNELNSQPIALAPDLTRGARQLFCGIEILSSPESGTASLIWMRAPRADRLVTMQGATWELRIRHRGDQQGARPGLAGQLYPGGNISGVSSLSGLRKRGLEFIKVPQNHTEIIFYAEIPSGALRGCSKAGGIWPGRSAAPSLAFVSLGDPLSLAWNSRLAGGASRVGRAAVRG